MPGFSLHGVYRPARVRSCVGGKGINLARVLRRLGHEARVLGFAGGSAGDYMRRELEAEGLACNLVAIQGESRLATTLLDSAAGAHTEVNELGPSIGSEEAERMLATYERELETAQWCAIGGSAPPGAPEDIYARMVALARRRGIPVLLDTNRQWLLGSYAAGADVLKPNQAELATIAGRGVDDLPGAIAAAREVVALGAGLVLVTLGESGALAVEADRALHATLACGLHVVSAVGSGDAFLAGYLAGWIEGRALAERLQLAVACGAANVEVFGPGFVEPERVAQLRAQVRVEPCEP